MMLHIVNQHKTRFNSLYIEIAFHHRMLGLFLNLQYTR